MKTTLIMLPQPILVSDLRIRVGDSYHTTDYRIVKWLQELEDASEGMSFERPKPIIAGIEGLPKLDLSLIAERIGWVDVERLALQQYPVKVIYQDDLINAFDINFEQRLGFIEGFKAAQSLNEKKYSEENMLDFCQFHRDYFTECSTERWNAVPSVNESFKVWLSKRKPKEYQVEADIKEGNTIKVTKIL